MGSKATTPSCFGRPSKLRQISFNEMRTYFSFGLILRDIPNSITPQNHPPPATDSGRTARTPVLPVQAVPLFFFLSQIEEPAKAGTCARDRRALQQLALNVHVKHSDLTWPKLQLKANVY